jgi:hypothetical protein
VRVELVWCAPIRSLNINTVLLHSMRSISISSLSSLSSFKDRGTSIPAPAIYINPTSIGSTSSSVWLACMLALFGPLFAHHNSHPHCIRMATSALRTLHRTSLSRSPAALSSSAARASVGSARLTSSIISHRTSFGTRLTSLGATAGFKTMASLKSSAPPQTGGAGKAYDPEIVDMAKYIHHYKVDSELAVSE